jgi:hypothetical protein
MSIGPGAIRLKGETPAWRRRRSQGEREMQQYLLSIYQPDGPIPPAEVLGPIMKNVDALRNEMKAAGAWVFSGGLHPPSSATVVRFRNGQVLTTDGPFAEGKEHLGGFTIVQAPDLDAALEWGRKLARTLTPPTATSGLAVEVRPFQH